VTVAARLASKKPFQPLLNRLLARNNSHHPAPPKRAISAHTLYSVVTAFVQNARPNAITNSIQIVSLSITLSHILMVSLNARQASSVPTPSSR
jgi:hypothetical protein